MSSLIEARIYHLPKEVNDAARYCSDRLSTHPLYPPLTEFLSACARTDPILGLALELRRPVDNISRLGIYVILPQETRLPDQDGPRPVLSKPSSIERVSRFHGTLARQILGMSIVSHPSFVHASSGNVGEKLTQLETDLQASYRLSFIPMIIDR